MILLIRDANGTETITNVTQVEEIEDHNRFGRTRIRFIVGDDLAGAKGNILKLNECSVELLPGS